MASNNAAPSSEHVTLVAPILQKLIDGVVLETLDQATGDDVFDDSPYERVLCAAWDVCTVADYAHAIESTSDFHRVFLKIITMTKRPRTRELAMGALANMACHWEQVGIRLLDDLDVLRLCRSILWNENDARVLLETTRLLNTMLVHSSSEQIVIEHENLTLFFEPQPMSPLVFHQYTQIICNTLHAELLLKALEFATRAVVYINAITHSLIQRQDRDKYIVKQDTLALMNWGAERLDEEGRGVGIGMGFNRLVAKNVMHLLWALTAYGLVSPSECGPLLAQGLGQSMCRLVSYIQEERDEYEDEDDDIQNLAEALNTKLSMS